MKLVERLRKIRSFWTLVLVPIWQEFVFRYLPYKFLYLPSGEFWLVGIISNIPFSAIHSYMGRAFLVFAFIAGMILWWIMVKFGLIYAILFHSIINAIDLGLGLRKILSG